MDLYVMVIAILLVSALLLVLSVKILAKSGWLSGFFRGFLGLSLLLLTIILGFSSVNITQFVKFDDTRPIATLSFEKVSGQVFNVKIKKVDSSEEIHLQLVGDMLQIGVEKLTLPFAKSSIFYQLSSIKTKYYSIEQQESQSNSNFSLKKDSYGISLWDVFAVSPRSGLMKSELTPFHAISEGELLSLSVFNGNVLLKSIDKSTDS